MRRAISFWLQIEVIFENQFDKYDKQFSVSLNDLYVPDLFVQWCAKFSRQLNPKRISLSKKSNESIANSNSSESISTTCLKSSKINNSFP